MKNAWICMSGAAAVLGGAVLTLTLAADVPAPARRPLVRRKVSDMKPTRSIVYKTTKDAGGKEVRLHLSVFEPAGHKADDRRAAIVFFFGGGWRKGSPEQFYPQCEYLASRGMVAMAAEYRIRNVHDTSPHEAVADAKSAIRYVRANAAKLGVDPKRIAAGGGSAGGHLAACTGLVGGGDEKSEDPSVSSRADALVLFNPVLDCSMPLLAQYGFGERPLDVSPFHHIGKGDPPTIIFHGENDQTIPVSQVRGFQSAMTKAGCRCEVEIFKGESHGFFNYGNRGNVAYAKTVRLADEFLASLGYISGAPTIKLLAAEAGAASRPSAP
jgi:acetyl esterase